VESIDRRLRVRFDRATDSFVPLQCDLEMRVPRGYTSVIADGHRRDLEARELALEDRSAVMMATRVPLTAHDILFE